MHLSLPHSFFILLFFCTLLHPHYVRAMQKSLLFFLFVSRAHRHLPARDAVFLIRHLRDHVSMRRLSLSRTGKILIHITHTECVQQKMREKKAAARAVSMCASVCRVHGWFAWLEIRIYIRIRRANATQSHTGRDCLQEIFSFYVYMQRAHSVRIYLLINIGEYIGSLQSVSPRRTLSIK